MTEEEKHLLIRRNLDRFMQFCKMTDCTLVFKSKDGLYGMISLSDPFIPDQSMLLFSKMINSFLREASIRIVYEPGNEPPLTSEN